MQKHHESISHRNNYSYSNVMKAGAVFFSTTMSYWVLSSLNWTFATAKEPNSEKDNELHKEGELDFTRVIKSKRSIQQSIGLPAQFKLMTLTGANGFSVDWTSSIGGFFSVSTAGDVNGDGLVDIVLIGLNIVAIHAVQIGLADCLVI